MRKAIAYVAGLLSFIGYYWVTSPSYIADTVRYAGDAVGHSQGIQNQFWEFGHLLWRPWAYAGYLLVGHLYSEWFADSPLQAACRFLIQTNFLCSFAVLLLVFLIVRSVVKPFVALVAVCGMAVSTAFIDYSHSGTPYIPALMFSAVALWLLIRAAAGTERRVFFATAGGVSFGIACALWMPYAFTGVGMVAVLLYWPITGSQTVNRRSLLVSFLGSLAAVVLVLFAIGAAEKGIGNTGELVKWIRESDNGWQQSLTPMRAVTGLPRSLWNLGADTVYLKRWVFHDPFNPAKINQAWAFRLALKVISFYLAIGAILWVLWKEGRALLFMLIGAGLPLLLFAIFLFEPSSTERFLPVFAFAFLGVGVVLSQRRAHVLPFLCVAGLLASMSVYNLLDSWRPAANARMRDTLRRIGALNGQIQTGAVVFVLTFNDDLYRLPLQNPLEKSLQDLHFDVTDAVFLASEHTAEWRAIFARRTLERWAKHEEVWVSERCLAAKPESDSKWVEGDDRRVHWPEIPAMFSALEYDSTMALHRDGFLRLTRNDANEKLLSRLAGTTAVSITVPDVH